MCKSVKLLLCDFVGAPQSRGAVYEGRLQAREVFTSAKTDRGNLSLKRGSSPMVGFLDWTGLNCFCCGLSDLIFSSACPACIFVVACVSPGGGRVRI